MTTTTEPRTFDEITDATSGFDLRDVIDRYETIEDDGEPTPERAAIMELLDEVRGYGGDEQWRGDWYPVQFIADSYFEEYARELAEDIGAIDHDAQWPNSYIDWDAAAKALLVDYSSVEINGATYWYR